MKIHLVNGTYELFRSFYGPPKKQAPAADNLPDRVPCWDVRWSRLPGTRQPIAVHGDQADCHMTGSAGHGFIYRVPAGLILNSRIERGFHGEDR